MIDLFATVMHVPQIVCVCYSTVNIGQCKQQVTECLLHKKFCMKFLFPGCIIICYNHNHIIKLVKFSQLEGGGHCLGGGQWPLLLSMLYVYSPVVYYV
jgi:hypothetical protein